MIQTYSLHLSFLPGKPKQPTLAPRIDPETREKLGEKHAIAMIDHQMYKRRGTLQRHREEIYIDVARAMLSALNDTVGVTYRSRLLSTRCRGDLNLLEAELLKQVVANQ